MDNHLLATKTQLPPLRPSTTSRPALLAQLDEGYHHKAILVSAPAGSGKTTILTQWIHHSISYQTSPYFVWLNLDHEDNNIQRFWSYVLATCQKVYNEVSEMQLYYASAQASISTLLTMLLNCISAIAEPLVLVLDNFHVITNNEILQSVNYLLTYCPATLHIVFSTRHDPQLPLARLRAHGDILEIREKQLRFSQSEIACLFDHVAGRQLFAHDVVRLEDYTDGWITGLYLIARTLQAQKPPISSFKATDFILIGTDTAIIDYLQDEVLSMQSVEIQNFLLETSILHHFTKDLCAAVTGEDNSEELLHQITQANLFLIPIDKEHRWYRYNHLFAASMLDIAKNRLGQVQLQSLYQKASDWYEQHGFPYEAIDTGLLAQDFARVAVLIQQIFSPLTLRFEFTLLIRWIEQLPQDQLQRYPDLYLIYAVSLFFTTRRQDMVLALNMAETVWSSENDQEKLGNTFVLRAVVAWCLEDDYQAILTFAEQALKLIPEHTFFLRGLCFLFLAYVHRRSGNIDKAWVNIQESQRLFLIKHDSNVNYTAIAIGDILYAKCEFDQALWHYQQVLQENDLFQPYHFLAHISMGALFFERNELNQALAHLSIIQDINMQVVAYQSLIYGMFLLADIQRALGKSEQAYETLAWITGQAKKQRQNFWQARVNAHQVRYALLDGNISEAVLWTTICGFHLDDKPDFSRKKEYFVLVSIRIACGELTGIFDMLERWYQFATEQGCVYSQLKLSLLYGLAYQAKGDITRATNYVRKVLLQAQSTGLMQIFLEEGASMALLLKRLKLVEHEQILIQYIDTLFLAFGGGLASDTLLLPVVVTEALLDQLTQREYNVLLLLVEGKSRQEMALALTVSINTIKTHIKNLYSKLNVSTRHEAIKRAHSLNLL